MDWRDIDGFFSDQDAADYRALYSMLSDGAKTAEVGCFRGRSIVSIGEIIKEKNIELYAIDPFESVSNPTYEEHGVQSKKEGMLRDFTRNIQNNSLRPNVRVVPMLSISAALAMIARELELVFLDGDHSYEAVKSDIEAWGPLLKEGGILCGHDWDEKGASWPGVHKAVVELLGWPSFREHIWAFRKINGEFKAEIAW